MLWRLRLVLSVGFLLLVAGCAGRGGVSIAISPSDVTLAPGATQEFTAEVKDSGDASVTWSASGGELAPSGVTAVFTAPAEEGTYEVTATSATDQGRWATASVVVEHSSDVPTVGSDGGVLEGTDGVSLVMPRGVLGEGEQVSMQVERVDAPALDVPPEATVLGSHHVFQLEYVGDLRPAQSASGAVVTTSLDGFGVAFPIPDGAVVDRLALAVLVRGEYIMNGETDTWTFVDGVVDEEVGLFLGTVYGVPADGLNLALVEHEDAAPTLNVPAGTTSGSSAVSPAATTSQWLSSFAVKAKGPQSESIVSEVEQYFTSLIPTFRDAGFLPFQLAITGRVYDYATSMWDYTNAQYQVTLKDYREVDFYRFEVCTSSGSLGPRNGQYFAVTSSLTVCTRGYFGTREKETAIHELLHSSQFASSNVNVQLYGIGVEKWVLEGTARLSERSMQNADYAIERDGTTSVRPIDVALRSAAVPYMYASQDFFAHVGERLGEDFTYVRHIFDRGATAGVVDDVLNDRYGMEIGDAYWSWVTNQLDVNGGYCRDVESLLLHDEQLLALVDGDTGDTPFLVAPLDSVASIITLENRDRDQAFTWGLSLSNQDVRSRARLYAMNYSGTTGCLEALSEGGYVSGAVSVTVAPQETQPVLLVISNRSIDLNASAFMTVEDLGYSTAPSDPIEVSIDPTSVTLEPGATQAFTATVLNAADSSVTWDATCGTIDGTGLAITYTAPTPAQTITCELTAISTQDSLANDTATITVEHASGTSPTFAASSGNSYAVLADGTVMAWGGNGYGQLGIGTREGPEVCRYGGSTGEEYEHPCSKTPLRVPELSNVVSVAAGGTHALALKDDGTVWAWGDNGNGQLGDGTREWRYSPQRVPGLYDVAVIAAGSAHSAAITGNGELWLWGTNVHGELAQDTAFDPDDCRCRVSPTRVAELSGVVQVALGEFITVARLADGTVWAWGFYYGLGNGTSQSTHVPSQVMLAEKASWIGGAGDGNYTVFAITDDEGLWWWGDPLCQSSVDVALFPEKVTGIANVSSAAIATSYVSCALTTTDGRLWEWGEVYDGSGSLGYGSEFSDTPVLATELQDVRSVAPSYDHFLAMTVDGDLYAWLGNSWGALGDGTQEWRPRPYEVSIDPVMTR